MTGPAMTGALVEALEVRAVTVPTDAPEADGTAEWDATTMVLVLARHRDVTGLGWTYGPTACGTLARSVLAPLVVGEPLLDIGSRYAEMLRAVRNAGRPGIATYAISAVDLALWDLKARLLGLPLHRLLGAVRDAVPVYGSGGFTTYDDDRTADQLAGWTGQGITDVKIKVGESAGARPERDLHRMALAREVIGPEAGLFVDANGGYTAKQAVRVMAEAEPLGIGWCEEPVSSDDLPGLRQVRDAVEPDVAAGEYGHDLGYFRAMCAAGAVDCLQADATRCGGITGWLGAAVVAQAHQLELSGHCAPHVHLAAAAAIPNLRHLEWFHDHVRIERMLLDGTVEPDGGVLRPHPDAAGTGLSLREDVAEEYAVSC